MIYVPGFEFIAGTAKKTPVLRDRTSLSVDKNFEQGKKYKLYYIKPNKDNVIYIFKKNEDGSLFEMVFESVSEADKKIAKLSGQQI